MDSTSLFPVPDASPTTAVTPALSNRLFLRFDDLFRQRQDLRGVSHFADTMAETISWSA